MAEAAVALGKPFLPHQRYMADVCMEIDPNTGMLAYSRVVLIGPRQVTGKTEFLLPWMTVRCNNFEAYGPQRVMYTAQTADEARLKWRDVHLKRLKASRKYRSRFTPRLTQNKEAFIWRNQSLWFPGSTTGKTAGTGDTLDAAVIDEAWSRENNRTELGLRPAMLTRRSTQLAIASMIPGISRALPGTWPYLLNQRKVGRARVEADVRYGTAYFEFSAPEDADPFDPATWWGCMPGLGYTVNEKDVREDFANAAETDTLVDICAEYLGWAPLDTVQRWMLISQDTWNDLEDPGSQIAGRPALAVEIDEDRGEGLIGTAGMRPDGHWHVEVVEPGHKIPADTRGIEWLLQRTVDIYNDQHACTVVIDPTRPAASLIVPLRNKGIDVYTPNSREIAGACGRFYDATGQERREDDTGVRVFHLGQIELYNALGAARKLDQGPGGAFTFVKKGTSGTLIPLYGVVLAMLGYEIKGGVDYDVLASVDSGRRCRCGRSLYVHDGVWMHAADDTLECGVG